MMYRRSHFYYSIPRAHSRDVEAVDESNGIVISGSADGAVKAWTAPRENEFLSTLPLAAVGVNDRIWSLLIDPTGTKVAIGSAGTTEGNPPLHIYDTTK